MFCEDNVNRLNQEIVFADTNISFFFIISPKAKTKFVVFAVQFQRQPVRWVIYAADIQNIRRIGFLKTVKGVFHLVLCLKQ